MYVRIQDDMRYRRALTFSEVGEKFAEPVSFEANGFAEWKQAGFVVGLAACGYDREAADVVGVAFLDRTRLVGYDPVSIEDVIVDAVAQLSRQAQESGGVLGVGRTTMILV